MLDNGTSGTDLIGVSGTGTIIAVNKTKNKILNIIALNSRRIIKWIHSDGFSFVLTLSNYLLWSILKHMQIDDYTILYQV